MRLKKIEHHNVHGEKSPNSGKFHVFSALHHHSQLKATVSYQDENAISKRQIKKETRLAQCLPASLGRNDVSRL